MSGSPGWAGSSASSNVLESRDSHRLAIRKSRHNFQLASHFINVLAKSRQQHVAALLQPRNAVLLHTEHLRHSLLRQTPSLTQIAQRLFLSDQLGSSSLDSLAALRGQ